MSNNKVWPNFRVIQFREGDDAYRAVHIVNYDSIGIPVSYNEYCTQVLWNVYDGAPADIISILTDAAALPVLYAKDFGENNG